MKARNRPPKLERRVGVPEPAPPPTLEERLVAARVAGRGPIGATELRRLVARLVAGDKAVLGGVSRFAVREPEVWDAIAAAYGAAPDRAEIDACAAVQAAARAGTRIARAAGRGARIAFATSTPAARFGLFASLARLSAAAGATVLGDDDAGPIRIDGRYPRWVRWMEGVAVATDGSSLLATTGADAAEEWLFRLGRPALSVADGWFADVAYEAGVEVVALVGLDRVALAVAVARHGTGTVVPAHPGRPHRAYERLGEALAAPLRAVAPSVV